VLSICRGSANTDVNYCAGACAGAASANKVQRFRGGADEVMQRWCREEVVHRCGAEEVVQR